MPLIRRLLAAFALILAAAVLAAAAAPPRAGNRPVPVRGPQALLGDAITFTTPQFKVEALWFKANDETGWYWTGSDEVYAVFSDMDPTHKDRYTSEYGNVDEGDTEYFRSGDRCMAPQPNCDRGMADLNVRFTFWESDLYLPLAFSYCPDDSEGSHFRLEFGCVDDDLIGKGSIIYSRDELVAMLPAVGDSREFTAVMDKNNGKYRFRYRITRLANVERSIVIHLPPLDPTVPPISLQAAVEGNRVRLTWAGATASNVDLYRNGANVLTTPNDGFHEETNVPSGSYQYRVCNAGSTTACSSDVTAVVP